MAGPLDSILHVVSEGGRHAVDVVIREPLDLTEPVIIDGQVAMPGFSLLAIQQVEARENGIYTVRPTGELERHG